MLPYPLTNLEIWKYNKNEHNFNEIYSRANLANRIKDEAFAINLDEYFHVGTHWIALYALDNDIKYFDRFGVEHVSKEIKNVLLVMRTSKFKWSATV